MQGLGQPQHGPDQHRAPEARQGEEDVGPRGQHQHQLPEARRHDRRGHEYQRGQGHHPRHLPPGIAVADHRHRDRPRGRRSHALQHPRDQHGLERARERREQAEAHIEAEPDQDHRPPAVAVRQGAVDHLAEAHGQQVDGDDQLALVLVGHAHGVADGRKVRQHGVDAERPQRHGGRHQHHEFHKARSA